MRPKLKNPWRLCGGPTYLLLIGCLFTLIRAESHPLPDDQTIDLYKKVIPAVVTVNAVGPRESFFYMQEPRSVQGSGVLIRSDGLIVTNEHVVSQAEDIRVIFSDRTSASAKLVGRDPISDLALLKVENPKGRYATLPFGDSNAIEVGRRIFVVGSPRGLRGSLATGAVGGLARRVNQVANALSKGGFQLDAAIAPGNSGGAVIDAKGRLLGVVTQAEGTTIGFAIPAKAIERVVHQLLTYGRVAYPNLGLTLRSLPSDYLVSRGFPVNHGVMVMGFDARVPSSKDIGLEKAKKQAYVGFQMLPYDGDLIFKIDETDIHSELDVIDYISGKNIGDEVSLYVVRGSSQKTFKVRLSEGDTMKTSSSKEAHP